jgi:RNA polymerase sigma-70 factor (ECF subfamily)
MDSPNHQSLDERLSRINTLWTVFFQAHASGDAAVRARQHLVQRYHRAVYRYLLGAVRDADAAQDLAQEFVVRFMRGAFHRADPQRGRFRDYLKTSLIHLANDYRRERQQQPGPLAVDSPAPDPDQEDNFLAEWREGLLERTWQTLSETNSQYHSVLLCRSRNQVASSTELAEEVSAILGKPMNSALFRKTLQRAQEKFADLLVEEVATSLEDTSPEPLEEELEELDLLKFCRGSLHRRKEKSAGKRVESSEP